MPLLLFRVLLVLVAVLTPGLAAMPAGAAGLSEKEYLADLPVVLSVTRLAQPLKDVPGAMTVIDADMIRRSGAREIGDVLRLVPGMVVARQGGGSTIVAYHALLDWYGARMQVYVDGRSIYSSHLLGDTHRGLGAVQVADIERIEVLRGSNSAAQGANAFLGVVNVVTRAPADAHGVTVTANKGQAGIDDNMVRVGWGNDRANLKLVLSRRATTGMDNLYDDGRLTGMQLRGDLKLGSRDELAFDLGDTREGFGYGKPPVACRTLLTVNGACDEDKERTDRWHDTHARATWQRTLDTSATLRVTAGFDRESYGTAFMAEQFATFGGVPRTVASYFNTGGTVRRGNLEIQRTDDWGGTLRTVVGGEWLHEAVHAPAMYSTENDVKASQRRLFGSAEWRPSERWTFNGGGVVERHSISGTEFAPRLAANFHLTPMHTLRAASTKAFHSPSLYMLRGKADLRITTTPALPVPFTAFNSFSQPYVAASGNLKAETVISSEVGYLGEFRAIGLKADFQGFQERMNRRFRTSGLDFINRPGPRIQGIEYQLDWRPLEKTRIFFGEAHVRESIGDDPAKEQLEAPRRSGSLSLFQDLPWGFQLGLTSNYVLPYMAKDAGNVIEKQRQLDIRLAWLFRAGKTRGELAWTTQAADVRHMEWQRTQYFTRRSFLTLRLDL